MADGAVYSDLRLFTCPTFHTPAKLSDEPRHAVLPHVISGELAACADEIAALCDGVTMRVSRTTRRTRGTRRLAARRWKDQELRHSCRPQRHSAFRPGCAPRRVFVLFGAVDAVLGPDRVFDFVCSLSPVATVALTVPRGASTLTIARPVGARAQDRCARPSTLTTPPATSDVRRCWAVANTST